MRFNFRNTALVAFSWLALQAQAETKINGFVDVQYAGQTHAWNDNGIYINDGAFYLAHTSDRAEFLLDLPFAASVATNSLTFAQTKAQAYLRYSTTNRFSLIFGQFDTIFGFEPSDTRESHFSNGGLLYTNLLPTTHAGLMGLYKAGSATTKFFIASPNDQGKLNGENPDVGFQIIYELKEDSEITAGTLLSFEGSQTRTLVNLMGGFEATDRLRVDLEFDLVEDPELANTTLAYLLNLTHSISESLALGARVEYLFNGTQEVSGVDVPKHSQFGVALGPKYTLTENVNVKAEYDLALVRKNETSKSDVGHGFRASVVYSF